MTWASHMIVGGATAKLIGGNIFLTVLGSTLPDLAEMVIPKGVRHRGITHSLALWLAFLAISFSFPVRDVVIGVVIGHLMMDALTPKGIPILDENSRHITIFGGKIKTASPGEFVITGLIAIISFFLLPANTISRDRDWKKLYEHKIIDRKEYDANRFRVF